MTLSLDRETALAEPAAAGTAPHQLRLADPAVRLDAAQRAVLEYDGRAALVVGAPGTGKTTVAVELVARRVAGGIAAASCLVVTPARAAAERLRDRLVRRLKATTSEPLSRTPAGLAYAVLREAALRDQGPLPRLMSGAEQDLVLRELLAGHRDGVGAAPRWPLELRAAIGTAGFRGELRELLTRAAEQDLSPRDLRELGLRTGRPNWVAAATVYQEYDDVLALADPGARHPADLCGQAAQRLESDPDLARRWQSRTRVLVVDDAQELTAPAARLLGALLSPSTRLVVLGDPDATTQGFRGADPLLPAALVDSAQPAGPTFVLDTAWRQGGTLRAVTGAVAGRIGAVGGGVQRRSQQPRALVRKPDTGVFGPEPAARPGSCDGTVEVRSFPSAGAQADYLASCLRRDHLIDGVAWSQLAVITRSAAGAAELRAALITRGVPVRVVAERPHLPSEPAVEPLLTVLDIAAGVARGRCDRVAPGLVEPLLRSSYGGLDAVGWRRLRRAARMSGVRVGDDAASLADPLDVLGRWLVAGPAPQVSRSFPGLTRIAGMIAAARSCATWEPGERWSERVSAAGVLWAAWSAAGLAPAWRDMARRHGTAAARADRDLDAVLALFEAAEWFDEHDLGSGPDGFVRRLRGLDFTAEPLARRGRRDCVEVTTAHGAVGRSWRRVAVARVQDGAWPDLRPRGSLLGGAQLAEVLGDVAPGRDAGTWPTREALRSDETRLFHVAVSRATEVLRVCAVDSSDDVPSPLFRAVAAVPGVDAGPAGDGSSPAGDELPALSLAGVTARLRRLVTEHPHAAIQGGAAKRLAALAAANVPGADPDTWWAAATATEARPRRAGGTAVRVSPSRLEDLQRCPLRWLVRACGARRPRPAGPARVGDLVHEILAGASDDSSEALLASLDAAWPRLGLSRGWLERRARADAELMLSRASRYLHATRVQGRSEIARELAVTTPVGEHLVTARFDRVEQNPDGSLRVVDFKTGSSKPTAEQVRGSAQLGAYQVALSGNGKVGGAALVQLGRAANQQLTVQEQPALADAPDPSWAHRLIASSAATMSGASVDARGGPWCRACEAAASCPVGGRR